MTYMRHPDDDLNSLVTTLRANIEKLAETLVGSPPNKAFPSKKYLRFGNKGALRVTVTGEKRGAWADFSGSHDKGSPLGLIKHLNGGDYAEAVAWARNWLGLSDKQSAVAERPERLIERAAKAATAATEAAADEARRIGIARKLWRYSVPVMGPAAAYLTDTRMIPMPTTGWPAEAVRFHKPSLSLILAATTADGAVQAVQRVYLTLAGRKIDDAEAEARRLFRVKQTDGVMAGAYIRLPGDPHGPLQLAEGPETGLTVWCATGHETWISLGGVAKIEPRHGRRIIVCADDDPRHAQAGKSNNAHQSRMSAVARWQAAGDEVQLLYPWPVRRGDKSDFNDLVQAKGIEAVRERINLALNPLAGIPGRVPVQETRVAVVGLVERFFAAALAWVPPAEGEEGLPPLTVATDPGVGAGKSSAAHRYAIEMLKELRAVGDHRTVVIATPTHRLSVDQANLIKALSEKMGLNVNVGVWHARARPDPEQVDKSMCWDLEAIADAKAAGVNPQDAVCGSGATRCQFADKCGYQKQRENTADIWLMSHELLFTRKPGALGTLAALIIDEGFLKAGIYGTDAKDERALTVDSLRGNLEIPGQRLISNGINELKRRQGEPLVDDLSDVLNRSRLKRLAVIDGAPDGWLMRSRLIAAGLTANEAIRASSLTEMMLGDPGIFPGMERGARKAAVEAARGNRVTRQDAMLWAAIAEQLQPNGPELSGNAVICVGRTEHGDARIIRMKGRLHIRAGWRVPTLLIDATLKINLVRPFYPHVQYEPTPPSAAPLQYITQVVGKAYAANGLVMPEPKKQKGATTNDVANDPLAMTKEAARRARRLAELRAWIILQARKVAPGEVLAVLQKTVEAALLKLGPLPANVRTGHHNALRGSNEFEHVRLLIIAGRTQPAPRAVELMAEALSGAGVEPIQGYYDQADAIREGADGKAELAGTDRHPDPLAEAIRWQICEGELIQLVGRGRGVNRTAANPLDVFLLTDIPLPLPVNRTITAAELNLTIAETQLAAGGAAFAIPDHAVMAYPDMWVTRDGQPSPAAARKAFQRDAREIQTKTFPNMNLLIGECPTLESWTYQLAGARQRPTTVLIDRSIIPDPKAWLNAKLGNLASCSEPVAALPEVEAAVTVADMPIEAGDMGIPPDALYRRGVLEPPPAYLLTIRSMGRPVAHIDLPAMGQYMGFTPVMLRGPSPLLLMERPRMSSKTLTELLS